MHHAAISYIGHLPTYRAKAMYSWPRARHTRVSCARAGCARSRARDPIMPACLKMGGLGVVPEWAISPYIVLILLFLLP